MPAMTDYLENKIIDWLLRGHPHRERAGCRGGPW